MMRISLSEMALAVKLRSLGVDFKQQVVIGPYIVDFLLHPNIVVECEGMVHSCRQERDYSRAIWLEEHGYKIWRIPNYSVFADSKSIARMLRDAQKNTDPY